MAQRRSSARTPRRSSRRRDRWQQRLLFASRNRTLVDYAVITPVYRLMLHATERMADFATSPL
jgi:hypothetical protein